MKIGKKIRAL